jgi:hypothetical protein
MESLTRLFIHGLQLKSVLFACAFEIFAAFFGGGKIKVQSNFSFYVSFLVNMFLSRKYVQKT